MCLRKPKKAFRFINCPDMGNERRLEMKIELRNVKHSEFASHETNCFECAVYIEGKKAGEASNDGQGGSTSIYPNTLYLLLQDYAKTLPPFTYEGCAGSIAQTADYVIDELLTEWLYARDAKRAMQKKILFLRNGTLMESGRMDAATLQKRLTRPDLLKELQADKILNLLPIEEAIKAYRGGVSK